MSKKGTGAGEGEGEGDYGSFFWEAQPWIFSNSDNSGGSERKSEKKPLQSSSNSPTGPPGEKKRGNSGRASKSSSSKGGGGDGGANEAKVGGAESDHEIHIWTERERRKKMRNMFSNLHALLPQLPSKTDKSTIVDEAVNYIKTLQQTLQKLQKQKLERLQGVSTASIDDPSSSSMTLQSKMGESREAFLADQGKNLLPAMSSSSVDVSLPRLGNSFQTWSSPNVVLNISGEDAHISICSTKKPGLLSTIFYVMEKHKLEVVSAHISSDCFRCMYMIHAHASSVGDQFQETLIEEVYKLAVGELILWLSS